MGHDTTIMLLLKTLGVYDDRLIYFCASVFFELRVRTDQEYIVMVSLLQLSVICWLTNIFASKYHGYANTEKRIVLS